MNDAAFPYLEPLGERPLLAVAAISAGVGMILSVFVLLVGTIALDVGVDAEAWPSLLVLVGAAGLSGAVAIVGVSRRQRVGDPSLISPLRVLRWSAVLAALAAAATVPTGNPTVLAMLVALMTLGCGLAGSMARAAACDLYPHGGWRVIAVPWSALFAGAALMAAAIAHFHVWRWWLLVAVASIPLAAGAVAAPAERVAGGAVGASLNGADRRSVDALLALIGIAVGAAAIDAPAHLSERWDQSMRGIAGVGIAVVASGAVVPLVSHWYGRPLERTVRLHLAAAWSAAALAALLACAGALSIHLVGLVLCWAASGGSVAVAMAAIDAATLRAAPPADRTVIAARNTAALGFGVSIGALTSWNLGALAGWPPAGRFAVAVTPLMVAGVWVAARRPELGPATAARGAPGGHQVIDLTDVAAPVLLECRDLSVERGRLQVLFDVSLRVEREEIVALIGPNGAGKTTLLRTISGLERPIGGRVLFDGIDLTEVEPAWRPWLGVRHIAAGSAVVDDLTVEENLLLDGHVLASATERRRAAAAAFEMFPALAERRRQVAATLSGGERQMLAIAAAVVAESRLVLIDEFSLGLAPTVLSDLVPAVRSLNRSGTAILVVVQSLDVALALADRVVGLRGGRVVLDASVDAVRANPQIIEAIFAGGPVR